MKLRIFLPLLPHFSVMQWFDEQTAIPLHAEIQDGLHRGDGWGPIAMMIPKLPGVYFHQAMEIWQLAWTS